MIKELLTRLCNHEELSREEARGVLLQITSGEWKESQIAALLAIYQMRTPSVDEVLGFREALLETRVRVDLSEYQPVDIVGTGGDGKNTFNISTCSCFVVAGAGYKVAKHGNYGATSISGASNVIEQHGVKFTNEESKLRRSIEVCGIAYMHAPMFNPAMKWVAGVRRELQIRTVFNLLGPLVNPSLPTYQLLGVANLAQMRLYSNVVRQICSGYGVVSSLDGYDEISLTGDFKVSTNSYDRLYTPADLGLMTVKQAELYGGDTPEEAVRIFDNVLRGEATRAQTECVVANSAFAIQAIRKELSVEECIAQARESIDSGRAYSTLKQFVELSRAQ